MRMSTREHEAPDEGEREPGQRRERIRCRPLQQLRQVAIAALERANVRPSGSAWSHAFVLSHVEGLLISRRKNVPTSLRGTLSSTHEVRRIVVYGRQSVSRLEAQRVLRAATMFVQASQGQEADA